MKKVYVVMIGWDYEGEELDMVYMDRDDAMERMLKLEEEGRGDYRIIRERELK